MIGLAVKYQAWIFVFAPIVTLYALAGIALWYGWTTNQLWPRNRR